MTFLASIYGNITCACGKTFDYSDCDTVICPKCAKTYVVRVSIDSFDSESDIQVVGKLLSEMSEVLAIVFHRHLLKKNFTREEATVLVSQFYGYQLRKLQQ